MVRHPSGMEKKQNCSFCQLINIDITVQRISLIRKTVSSKLVSSICEVVLTPCNSAVLVHCCGILFSFKSSLNLKAVRVLI